jgi:hypothetical protein
MNDVRIPHYHEDKRWSDAEGEGVYRAGRITIFAKPSMTSDDGTVAVGIEAPWIDKLAEASCADIKALEARAERAEAQLREAREALETLDLSDDHTFEQAQPGELVSCTRPIEIWVQLRSVLGPDTGKGASSDDIPF